MSETITLSVREFRLIVERVLLITGLPRGVILDVREAVLRSEALGLGGLDHLRTHHADLGAFDPDDLKAEENRGELRVAAHGMHAWPLATTLLDLVIARTRAGLAACVTVRDVAHPAELRVIEALAPQGARVRVDAGEETIITCDEPNAPTQLPDPVLARALRDGLCVGSALWWELYHLSARALTPDSVQSRRHAGPIILEPDGSVTGRLDTDEDTDLTLLGAAARAG